MATGELLREVLGDLRAEGDELEALVAPLDEAGWGTATPAVGWTVAHQVAHLWWADQQALLAIREPEAFAAAARHAHAGTVDEGAGAGVALPRGELLNGWRRDRAALADALAALPAGTRLPWFGPPMSAASMATARLMEEWAHGLDVADALGVERAATPRLRHIAHLGVRTRDFGFAVRGLEPPREPFRVELDAPGGDQWCFGPEDARQRVTGPALDFCLLVTQRRHRAALRVSATGPDADRWLDVAQAFAGPPGTGRAPP